ncbi:MAG TPA: hypothetical protein VMT47_13290 [Polyangia bacterium]|nr:hypothetical protein [Polyangia bacterium]
MDELAAAKRQHDRALAAAHLGPEDRVHDREEEQRRRHGLDELDDELAELPERLRARAQQQPHGHRPPPCQA